MHHLCIEISWLGFDHLDIHSGDIEKIHDGWREHQRGQLGKWGIVIHAAKLNNFSEYSYRLSVNLRLVPHGTTPLPPKLSAPRIKIQPRHTNISDIRKIRNISE